MFAKVGKRELKLDLDVPVAGEGAEKPPLFVWIHGGGWRSGSKERSPLRVLAKDGYAVASISYRFSRDAIFPAQIHDCKAAIRWLRAHANEYGYDAEWVAVGGSSAGGHLALLVGISGGVKALEGDVGGHLGQSSTVQAIVDYYGPADFVLRGRTQPQRAYTTKSGSFALLGGVKHGKVDPALEKLASPTTHVDENDPPLLVFHGTKDGKVLIDQSERIVSLYDEHDLDATLVTLAGAGHGGAGFFNGANLTRVRKFLAKHRPPHGNSADAVPTWPPATPGSVRGTVSISSDDLLAIPAAVAETRNDDGVASFVVAEQPPSIHLAFHRKLGPNAVSRRLWSSWGDITAARDGSVYVGIGDHGNAVGGDARCFVHRWDPNTRTFEKIVDMNDVVPPRDGQPAWSKIHAKIDEGPDGAIYFSCTLNDGKRASRPEYRWNEGLPGGQVYRYDPLTGKTGVFASLPAKRCTATSLVDAKRGVWWCNLESVDGDSLFAVDLHTGNVVHRGTPGEVAFNRNFALAADGSVYFNGDEGRLMRLDPTTHEVAATAVTFPDSPGMRASTRESRDGTIFGTTHRTGQLFRYDTRKDRLELLGPTWGTGQYTTDIALSPDERFLYYLPGSHGKAWQYGTPVVQYEIATGKRKVLAFLAAAFEKRFAYVPAGTYGIELAADGGTLYVNFNGHAADAIRPDHMKPNGFGLCGFVAIEVPKSER